MRKYCQLQNFRAIFNRGDFNYIADAGIISRITRVVGSLTNPKESNKTSAYELKIFLKNLDSFYDWLNSGVGVFNKGHKAAEKALVTAIAICEAPPERRLKISRSYLRKLNRNFLYGLSKLVVGIRKSFGVDELAKTNINAVQIANYIISKDEGLAKKFLLNHIGNHGFVNKLDCMPKQELIVVMRLLLRPSANQVRTFNGWCDLGLGHAQVRILTQKHTFGKMRVYFLFRLSEHRDYERQLAVPPDRTRFSWL